MNLLNFLGSVVTLEWLFPAAAPANNPATVCVPVPKSELELCVSVDKTSKKYKIGVYQKLFLASYLKHLIKGDYAEAMNAVYQKEDDEVAWQYEMFVREIFLCHRKHEKMVEEAFSLPLFYDDCEARENITLDPEYKSNLKARKLFLRSKKETLYGNYAIAWSKIHELDKLPASNLQINLQLQAVKECKVINEEIRDILSELDQIYDTIHCRDEFIIENPKLFVLKEFYTDDMFKLFAAGQIFSTIADDQIITVIDDFRRKLPKFLEKKCHNFLVSEKTKIFHSEKPDEGFHGIAVTSVILDDWIGVCPGAKFYAIDMYEDFLEYYQEVAVQPSNTPLIDLEKDSFGAAEIDAIEDCFLRGYRFISTKVGNCFFIFDMDKFPNVPGMIVNLSVGIGDYVDRERFPCSMLKASKVLFMLHLISGGKIMVWAAGNESTIFAHSDEYIIFKNLARKYPQSFIIALGLSCNLMFMELCSNQPGNHLVRNVCLCARGGDVEVRNPAEELVCNTGTSFAAPYISGAAAILASNFPEAGAKEIISALLDNATPVFLIKKTDRIHMMPYLPLGVSSKDFKPGYYSYKKGFDGEITKSRGVDQKMIDAGRNKYGAGILNIEAALKALDNKFGGLKQKEARARRDSANFNMPPNSSK